MNRFDQDSRDAVAQKGTMPEAERLRRVFDLVWDNQMGEFPEQATGAGYSRYQDRWTDWADSAIERRRQRPVIIKALLGSFDRDSLPEGDQLSYDLLMRQAEIAEQESRYDDILLPISQMHGPQQEVPRILELMPMRRGEDRAAVMTRLERVPALIDQTIVLLERGLGKGVTYPKVCLRDLPSQVAALLTATPGESALLAFLSRRPSGVGEQVWREFSRSCESLCLQVVMPAFKRLQAFLTERYIPGCTERTGWLHMPNGAEWYRFIVQRETTTDLSPDDIFGIGMTEVARIRAEMERVMRQTGFAGTFDQFCEHLRTDSKFFFTSADDLVRAYRDIAKRADPELVKLFATLPRLPYGVVPIPPHAEKSQTTAYYQPGAPAAGRPGYYYVNTYDLPSRPKWEMEALSLHEAVPGHHLQIARMQELTDLPEFRRQSWITAYGEGWALYAESLGADMGFYSDPFALFGALTYDMWRAIRLVVDPGMHHRGWSREQAITFFRQNSSKSLHDITVEIDRYLVWPGQALSYKIGQLRIQAMRADAEATLGERFDLRAFHDTLLGSGCVPLDVLESLVRRWVAAQQER